VPLDPDNSEVQCLASEVKTPDFKKAICCDDETESEEDIVTITIPTYACNLVDITNFCNNNSVVALKPKIGKKISTQT